MRQDSEVETLLNRWLAGARPELVIDPASIAVVRESVRRLGAEAGLSAEAIERLALVGSELGGNLLRHAGGGTMVVSRVQRGPASGVEVLAADRGPGLEDPASAWAGDQRPGGPGLGIGFSSVFRNCDTVDLDSRLQEGLCIRARSFAGDVPRERQVVTLGRPLQGERVSGDDAAFRRDDGILNLLVVDGLGHGPEARDAARPLCQALLDGPPPPDPVYFLRDCHARFQKTRGCVAAAVRFDTDTGQVLVCSVGNVACHILRPDAWETIPADPGVLGRPGPAQPRFSVTRLTLAPDDVLLLCTDGVSSRLDVGRERTVRRDPALLIADAVLRLAGRKHDDATVMVVK